MSASGFGLKQSGHVKVENVSQDERVSWKVLLCCMSPRLHSSEQFLLISFAEGVQL